MRTSDVDILILPGIADAGDASSGHWYARWEARLPTARRVPPGDASGDGSFAGWTDRLVAAVMSAERPVVLGAHDLGAFAVAGAAERLAGRLAGAFLVAAPSPEAARTMGFGPAGLARLPFPAVLVASRDDPQADWSASEAMARAWGAELVDAGASGRLDGTSGHGPWPEGLMRFAGFLKQLAPPAQAPPEPSGRAGPDPSPR